MSQSISGKRIYERILGGITRGLRQTDEGEISAVSDSQIALSSTRVMQGFNGNCYCEHDYYDVELFM